jgi:dTDP-4-dehydrorhamnose 3,5-epimerase
VRESAILLRMANLVKIETSLPDVWELRTKVFRDARGFFLETYRRDEFSALGFADTFVQENHSWSKKGILRGLHYQLRNAQAKICRVAIGEALDIAVDMRLGSPFFGKWASVRLSADTQNQIYIPAGFAHGFLALSEEVHFLYKCSDYYHPGDEFGVVWNDPELKIDWCIQQPIISEKDAKLPQLATIPRQSLPQYTGE